MGRGRGGGGARPWVKENIKAQYVFGNVHLWVWFFLKLLFKTPFKLITNKHQIDSLSLKDLADSQLSIFCVQKVNWLLCLWHQVTTRPHSIQTSDVNWSANASRGHSPPLHPPSFPSYLLCLQYPLVIFPTQSSLAWKCHMQWQIFFFLGLCNTLIYALFSHMGFILWERQFVLSFLAQNHCSLYWFSRLNFFNWKKCATARFQCITPDWMGQIATGQVSPWLLHHHLPLKLTKP